jgi:hypothetical protein
MNHLNVNNKTSFAEQRARGVKVASVAHTPITHPDKLWWPEEGITKLTGTGSSRGPRV